MKPSEKKSVNYTVILSVLCIFILGVFASCYAYIIRSSYNSYENSLSVYIKAINKANISTDDFMKEGTINTQMTKTNIPNIIITLQNSKDKIEVLNPSNKFKFYQASLIQGLTNNINIYVQILNVLNNPKASDIGSSRDNVKSFKEVCIDCYSKAVVGKIKVSLQKNTINFIDSYIYYLDQLVKIKRNQSILDSQNTDFVNAIDETFKNFQIIRTDFKPSLYSIRNNKSSYDDLINLIVKNKTDLSNLKIDFAKISVPEKSQTSSPILVFDTFKNSINDYNLYLDSFVYALSNEKVQALFRNIDKNVSDKFYIESDIKMSKVTKDYNDFVEIYNGFKDIK